MTPVVVLAPSRGRPDKAAEMVESFRDTAVLMGTELILVVDADDPRLPEYEAIPSRFMAAGRSVPLRPPDPVRVMVLAEHETGDLTRATNTAAARVWGDDCIIGHVGDDHRFRTPGWDRIIRDTLAEPGIAYGDDLLQGERLPTAVFISSLIPRALGWYALPTCSHLYIDDAWRLLGRALRSLHYLPDVVIEHLHPGANKAAWDDGYDRAFARIDADREAYETWRRRYIRADVRNVERALRRAA